MFDFSNESGLPVFGEIVRFARSLFVYASVARVRGSSPRFLLRPPVRPSFVAVVVRPSYSHPALSVVSVFFLCPLRASLFSCLVSGVFYGASPLRTLRCGSYWVVCCPVQWVRCREIDFGWVFSCVL